jgi:hypothetical protein
MTSSIITAITSIISLLVGFFLHVFYENRRERRQGQNESIRNHFKQLETSIINPVTDIVRSITNSEEALSIKGASPRSLAYDTYTKNLEQGDYYIFKLHFPDQEDKVKKLMGEVNKHNEFYESLTDKLKELVREKTGVPVRRGGEYPFVYEDVPYYLRQTLVQLNERESLRNDFRNSTIKNENELWKVGTQSLILAEVTTEAEANFCKRGLVELMESASLLEEVSSILKKSKQLEKESRSIANLLDFTCWQYRESGQLLNEHKDCPYCQAIFQPQKSPRKQKPRDG